MSATAQLAQERRALLKYLLQVGAAVVEPTPRGLRDPAFAG